MAKKKVNRLNCNLARRLREARQETGWSTRSAVEQLPRRLAISHSTLASYERGETMPTLPVLAALADIYKRTPNWFLEGGSTLHGIRYRNLKSHVRVTDKRTYEAQAGKWIDAYIKLERRLKQPLRKQIGEFDISDSVSPIALAASVRRSLGLTEDDPVTNIIDVLEERFAIRVMELESPMRIDGLAARKGAEFVIVLNPQTSNDRLRLNAAHELAHVLYDDCKEDNRLTDSAVEARAYRFACSLLLPESQLREAFAGESFLKLIKFKEKFGISLAAMIFRAERAKLIPSRIARWLWIEMSKRGWKKHEPGYVWRDRALRFETMLESAIRTQHISWGEAEQVTGVRQQELKNRLEHITTGVITEDNSEEEPQILSFV